MAAHSTGAPAAPSFYARFLAESKTPGTVQYAVVKAWGILWKGFILDALISAAGGLAILMDHGSAVSALMTRVFWVQVGVLLGKSLLSSLVMFLWRLKSPGIVAVPAGQIAIDPAVTAAAIADAVRSMISALPVPAAAPAVVNVHEAPTLPVLPAPAAPVQVPAPAVYVPPAPDTSDAPAQK